MATDPTDIELTTSPLTSAQALPSVEIHPAVSSPRSSPPVDSTSSPHPSATSNPLQRSETATSSTTQVSTTSTSSTAPPDQTSCGPSPGISPNPSLSPTLCNTNTFSMLAPSMIGQPTTATDQNRPRRFRRPSIQELIGLISLLVACIGLFVYSHRSFVMAKWTAYNDLLTTCAQLKQVELLLARHY